MKSFQNLLLWVLFFGLLGSLASSFVAPSIIGALFTPPVQFGTNCEPAGTWAMMSLRKTQFVCFVIGALSGAILFWLLKNRRKNPEAGA